MQSTDAHLNSSGENSFLVFLLGFYVVIVTTIHISSMPFYFSAEISLAGLAGVILYFFYFVGWDNINVNAFILDATFTTAGVPLCTEDNVECKTNAQLLALAMLLFTAILCIASLIQIKVSSHMRTTASISSF